jgi:amino acid adenylation domain-containing protein
VQPLNLEFEFCDIDQAIGLRFHQVANSYPNHIAIETASQQITYATLATRARQFAALLKQRGCVPGDAVVIALRAAEDIVTAIMGTLIAGGIYVPVEMDYPAERIQFIVDETAAAVFVADHADRDKLASLMLANSIFMDEIIMQQPLAVAEFHTDTLAPASILYTSGSTGKPKGVMQIHRNILFHIYTLTQQFAISAWDKHSVLSSFVFDGATTDLYCALLNGATLVPVNVRMTGAIGLAQIIKNSAVTLYHSTPTTYRELVNLAGAQENFASVRLIILGGETVTAQDFELAQKYFPASCLFVNGYGATETSGFVALNIMPVNLSPAVKHNVWAIGLAPAGIEHILLDAAGHAADEGELYISSKYLALGYWKNPELTAQVYQFAPVDPLQHTRIYRTGDLAQRVEGGAIKLLGRQDRQVKIRGHRIDLAEIEAIAAEHPALFQVAVKVYEDNRTLASELVLFATLRRNYSITPRELRSDLSHQLPRYMVPASIEIRPEFPLTTTGKIDIKALVFTQHDSSMTYLPSFNGQNKFADTLTAIWCEVLGISEAGQDDNFFDLGGTSLLMARVHVRLEQELALNLPLFRLFEYPTLRALIAQQATTDTPQDFAEIYKRRQRRSKTRELSHE